MMKNAEITKFGKIYEDDDGGIVIDSFTCDFKGSLCAPPQGLLRLLIRRFKKELEKLEHNQEKHI